MCTRRQAIDIIMKEKRGTIVSIKRQIGDLYDSFVVLGFIKERLVLNDVAKGKGENVEWEVTPLASRKREFYRLLSE